MMAEPFFPPEVIRQFAAETSAEEERRAALSSTEAGRALIRASRTVIAKDREVLTISDGDVLDAILAIEAEARADLRAELAAKVEALPTGKAKSMRWNLPTQTVELLSRAAVLAAIAGDAGGTEL